MGYEHGNGGMRLELSGRNVSARRKSPPKDERWTVLPTV